MAAAGIDPDRVKAFLEDYASAFARADKAAVADRYGYPAHAVTHDGGVGLVAVPSREVWTAVVERILEMYRAMGVHRAELRDVRVTDVSAEVAQARVVWVLHGKGDRLLYEFEATYTLALLESRLKIVQVITENEQPKFRDVMRERG
jgi:hypothetical protein